MFESSRHPADREDFEATGNENLYTSPNAKGKKTHSAPQYVKEYFKVYVLNLLHLLM